MTEAYNLTDPFRELYLELKRFTGERKGFRIDGNTQFNWSVQRPLSRIEPIYRRKKVVELREAYNLTDPFRELYLELKRFAGEKKGFRIDGNIQCNWSVQRTLSRI